MELHQQAYKKAFITTKHHWAGHHPQQWERDGFPFDCWTGERKHRVPKRIAHNIKSKNSFEVAVVTRQVIHRVRQLKEMSLQSGLLRPVTPSEVLQTALGVKHCLVARSLRYLGATFSVNDVLCFGNGMLGEVKACCEADDAHVLLVKKMECIDKVSNSNSLCSVGSLAAVNLKDYPIYTAYAWTTVERCSRVRCPNAPCAAHETNVYASCRQVEQRLSAIWTILYIHYCLHVCWSCKSAIWIALTA